MRSHCGTTLGFDGGYYMTCSKNLGKLLQASCLGLVGMLAGAGCGGSDNTTTTPDAAPTVDGGGGGTTGTVAVNVNPPSADFGSVVKGASSSTPTVITVTNRGVATSLSPSATGPFAITGTTCGTLGAAGTAAGTCTISLSFTPTAVGPASGTLIVTTTGVSVTLTGTGVAPGSFIVTDKVDLGQVLVNAKATGAVTVSATTAVTGLSCALSGADITADATKVCPATLAAGATCTVGFTFQSATAGSKNDAVVCSATGVTQTTTIVADVVTPASLAFQPPATVAVSAPVGSAGSPVSFTLVNSGGAASGALTVTPSGADAAQFVIDNQCVLPLTALNFCKINVTFKPTTAGAKVLTLTVTDANAVATAAPLVATVNGTATPPGSLTLTGAATDFGTVAVGAASAPALVFTLTNPGASDTSTVTVATSDPQFVITSNACNGVPLAAGKTCNVSVVFKPSAAGPASANLSASATGTASATLPIKGLATGAAALTLTPPTLDFGTTGVNVPTAPQTFTVTNTGGNATGALTVIKKDSTSSTGGGTQFTSTTTCGAALAPGATCNIVVTYAPTIAGNASATFTVSDGTVTSAASTVVGTALALPGLSLACTGQGSGGSFDGTSPGTPTASGTGTVVGKVSTTTIVCTVQNGANSTQATGAITATPTGDFAVGTNNCTGALASLAVGESCTLVLTFTPTARGERDGIITVTSANGGTANLNLYGTGVSVVQIDEVATVSGVTGVQVQPYDFGQVSLGATSTSTTHLTLNVYVRGSVGNLAISGTDLKFLTDTAPADFIQVTGGTPTNCTKITTTAPPASNNVYCQLVVAFNPQAMGAQAVTFTAAGANGTSDTATAKGTGTGPLTIAPSPLTFAAVAVGSSGSQVLPLTITNNAPSTGSNATITITGPNAADFSLVTDPISNQTLTGGGGVYVPTIRVTVPAGAAVGALSATVTVTTTIAGVTQTATGSLVGSAVAGAGITAALNGTFANTVVSGTSAPVTVTVTNAGALTTGALTAQLGGGGDFTIDPPGGQAQATCVVSTTAHPVASPTTLAPNASCTLNVWFTPGAGLGPTARSGTLTVGSTIGGTQTLSLTGQATGLLTITPATQDVGLTVIGDPTPAVVTFTITNNGGQTVVPSIPVPPFFNDVGQTGASDFVLVNHCPASGLGAAGSTSPLPYCTVDVSLQTTGLPGPRAATLKVTGTVGGVGAGTATAVVTGTAANLAKLQLTPVDSSIIPNSASTVDRDFGNVRMFPGAPTDSSISSAPQTFVVTNVGGFASTALSFAFYDLDTNTNKVITTTSHAKLSDLDLTGTTCQADGAILNAGQSCIIQVAFHPSTCPQNSTTTTCPATTLPLAVQLVITAAKGTENMTSARLLGPKLYGNPILSTAPYIVELTGGKAPYDFVSGKAGTTSTAYFAINSPGTSSTVEALSTFQFGDAVNLVTGAAGTSSTAENIVTAVGEFSVGTVPAGTSAKPCLPIGTSLPANDYCVFAVNWNPTSAHGVGTREVTANAGIASINILGRVLKSASLVAVPYPIAQSASPVAFGNAVEGVDSLIKTITIMNVGEIKTTDDLTVVDLGTTLSGQVKVESATTCQGTGSALAVGATCTVALAVHPADANAHTAVAAEKIALVSDSLAMSLMNGDPITVSWTGVAAAKLTPSPTSLAFDTAGSNISTTYTGTGVLATTDYINVTITNTTGAPATGPLSISTSAADFYIDPSITNSTCLASGLAFSGLAGGASCTVRVYFSPVSLATPAKTGNLVVTPTSAPAISIPMTGTAIPALTVSATAASGNTFTGTTSSATATLAFPATSATAAVANLPTQLFTFKKASGSPATGLLSSSLGGGTGATPSQFKVILDNCTGATLSDTTPGTTDQCQVTVRFAPTGAGANLNAVLTVTDPSSGTPADSISVALSGNANP
jgi:hypothetical protein